ncbi:MULTISPECIES: diguanylate cyclase [Pseudoalteromonas]|uniref:diguanylate cyclase n=1 Tax=Pseudoalteromonas amylolytica TaxID=1859457 RepID=A0A1S1MNB1_9GAMM|nr:MULTISPECIES: diguanylate cyclase [Pseudoalteromonas]OHU86206.1 hypothetical protein BFC16_16005 [Pseudoalteromonas sp. JW3]OHU89688.1 hypothetical protein BET10_16315 [Pseudoalteromonas amylolytica]
MTYLGSPIIKHPRDSRVLIVDDEPVNRTLMESCLNTLFNVTVVDSAEAALAHCEATPPDLILMDLVLPHMSGLQACQALKRNQDTQHIPIIMVTSSEDETVQNKCWDAGCSDFIAKPINGITLRNRVKIHLNYKHQTEALQRLSYIDGLTGVNNRNLLAQLLPKYLQLGERNKLPTGALMIDVDWFKLYNDTYGHLKGDEVLRLVAQTIADNLHRPSDLLFRYGGEEFLGLLADTDHNGVAHVANMLNKKVRELAIPHEKSPFGILTISIGCAVATPNQDIKGEKLLQLADNYLYRAKQKGRDAVEVHV